MICLHKAKPYSLSSLPSLHSGLSKGWTDTWTPSEADTPDKKLEFLPRFHPLPTVRKDYSHCSLTTHSSDAPEPVHGSLRARPSPPSPLGKWRGAAVHPGPSSQRSQLQGFAKLVKTQRCFLHSQPRGLSSWRRMPSVSKKEGMQTICQERFEAYRTPWLPEIQDMHHSVLGRQTKLIWTLKKPHPIQNHIPKQ